MINEGTFLNEKSEAVLSTAWVLQISHKKMRNQKKFLGQWNTEVTRY